MEPRKIRRAIYDQVKNSLFKGKVIVIYGARQVGKTTLVKDLGKEYGDFSYFSCDEPDVVANLSNKTSTELISFLGPKKFIIIDEAQRVTNIGITLKLLADNFPNIQIIATGSSSFDLANQINEPLTGRKRVFYLPPLTLNELISDSSKLEVERTLERKLILGMYPEVIFPKDSSESTLRELSSSYLYKDILKYEEIKNPDAVYDLVKALALQIGGEVSYNELANLIGIDKKTVMKYVSILEKAFIVFRVRPWHKKKRSELGKLRKIYFYDNGLRNAIINNLNPINMRSDAGELWENFVMSEIKKKKMIENDDTDIRFWRTYNQQEVDYIEEKDGKITVYEFKWKPKKGMKIPSLLTKNYENIDFHQINTENYLGYLA